MAAGSRPWPARPVAIGQLRELGEQLVDVHGQHAHQALLKTQAQRELIDEQLGDLIQYPGY